MISCWGRLSGLMKSSGATELNAFYPIKPECVADVPATRFKPRVSFCFSSNAFLSHFLLLGQLILITNVPIWNDCALVLVPPLNVMSNSLMLVQYCILCLCFFYSYMIWHRWFFRNIIIYVKGGRESLVILHPVFSISIGWQNSQSKKMAGIILWWWSLGYCKSAKTNSARGNLLSFTTLLLYLHTWITITLLNLSITINE